MPDSDGVILFEADLDERDLIDGLKSIDRGLDKLGRQSKTTSKKVDVLSNSTKTLNNMFRTFATGYIINQMGRLGSAAIEVAARYEVLDIRMQTAFRGSAEAAQYAIGWTREFATKVPSSLDTVTDKFVMLQTAGLNPLDGSMQSIFDASNKVGGGLKKLEAIMGGLIKANTNGKIQQEQFNMMQDAGVPAIDLMANALGRNADEIVNMSRKSELGRDKIKLLIDEMGKWASGASIDMMESMTGKLTNLEDTVESMTASFLDQGGLDGFKQGITNVIQALEDLESSGQLEEMGTQFGTFVNSAAERIPKIVDGISDIIDVAEGLIPILKTVGETMLIIWSVEKLRTFSALLVGIPGRLSSINSAASGIDKIAMGLGAAVIAGNALADLLDELATDHLKSGFTAQMDDSMAVMREWKAEIESDTEVASDFREMLKKINEESARERRLPDWLGGKEGHPFSVDMPEVDISGLEAFDEKSASADQWLKWFDDVNKSMKAAEKSGRELTKTEKALLKVLSDKAELQKKQLEDDESQKEKDLEKARILTEFKLLHDDLAKAVEERDRRERALAETENSAAAQADKLQLSWQGLEYQAKLTSDQEQMWKEKEEELEEQHKLLRNEMETPIEPNIIPIDPPKVDAIFASVKDSATHHLSGLMTDLLSGDSEALKTFFNDFFGEVGDNASAQLSGIFQNIMSGKKPGGEGELTGIMDLFSGENAGNMWRNIGSVIGSGMMERAQQKQDRRGAIIGGAIQGGLATMSPVGAIVGAVMGYLSTRGGEKKPQTIMQLTAGGAVIDTRHQGETEQILDTASRQLMAQYSATELSLRDVIKGFGDIDLMAALSGALPTWATPGAEGAIYSTQQGLGGRATSDYAEGSLQSFIDYLTQGGLMQAFMEQRYAPLMLQGLQQAGMDEGYIQTILTQIGQATSSQQVEMMKQLVSAATGIRRAEEEGYEGLREQALLSPTETLWSNLSEINNQMGLSITGLESMRPADRIGEWETLSRSLDAAGNAVGQFIQQLDVLAQSIHDQATGLIEQLDLQHMGTGEQAQYFMDKIRAINEELGTATDKGQIERLSSQAFSYQQQLAGLLQGSDIGDTLYGMGGETLEGWLREQIMKTDTIAQERIAALEATAQEYYQGMLDKVAFFGEALGIFGDTIMGFNDWWLQQNPIPEESQPGENTGGPKPPEQQGGPGGGGTEIQGGKSLAMTPVELLKTEISALTIEVAELRKQYVNAGGIQVEGVIKVAPDIKIAIEMDADLKTLLARANANAEIIANDAILKFERKKHG
jgi:tape measure domain-containing protein